MSRILYRGGNVYSPTPAATAMLVADGLVAWIGSDAAASSLGEPDGVVELDGAWVAPAFVDAHVHVIDAGLALTVLDLADARSLAEVLRRVGERARGAPADALIWGTGWDETRWAAGEPRRGPTPRELDTVCGGRLVYLPRADLHSAAASTALLLAAGVEGSDAPVTGPAHHALRATARRLLPPRQREQAAAAFFGSAAGLGIGMVHDCCGPDIGAGPDIALVRRAAEAAGIDLVSYWGEAGSAGVARARGYGAEPAGDVFVDGSLGSHTAALSRPYADHDPAERVRDVSRGSLQLTSVEIADHLAAATRAGAQAGFHVIGDAAISAVVEGFELAAAAIGHRALAAARHRLEHVEMSDARHRSTLARYGVVACVQPAFSARWGGPTGMYADRLGVARASSMNDFAGFVAAGVPLAFGSDAPVTPLDPWGALRAAASTADPGHALSARAAFAAHTRGGHRAARREHGGVLEPGADATFAIWTDPGPLASGAPDSAIAAWSTDPRGGAPGLPDLGGRAPRCAATVVHGRVIFDGKLPATQHQPS